MKVSCPKLVKRLQNLQFSKAYLSSFDPWLREITRHIYELSEKDSEKSESSILQEKIQETENELSRLEACHQTLEQLLSIRQVLERKCLNLKEALKRTFSASTNEIQLIESKLDALLKLLKWDMHILIFNESDALSFINEFSSLLSMSKSQVNEICRSAQLKIEGMRTQINKLQHQNEEFLQQVKGLLEDFIEAGFAEGVHALIEKLKISPPKDISEQALSMYQKQVEELSSDVKQEIELLNLREIKWIRACKWLRQRILYWKEKLEEFLKSNIPQLISNEIEEYYTQLRIVERDIQTSFQSLEDFKEGEYQQNYLLEEAERILRAIEKAFKSLEAQQKKLFEELDILEDLYTHFIREFNHQAILVPFPDLKNKIDQIIQENRSKRENLRRSLFASLGDFNWSQEWESFSLKQKNNLASIMDAVRHRIERVYGLKEQTQLLEHKIAHAQYPISEAHSWSKQIAILLSLFEKNTFTEPELLEWEKRIALMLSSFETEQEQHRLEAKIQHLRSQLSQAILTLRKQCQELARYFDLADRANHVLNSVVTTDCVATCDSVSSLETQIQFWIEQAKQSVQQLLIKAKKRDDQLKLLEDQKQRAIKSLDTLQNKPELSFFNPIMTSMITELSSILGYGRGGISSWKEFLYSTQSTITHAQKSCKKILSWASSYADLLKEAFFVYQQLKELEIKSAHTSYTLEIQNLCAQLIQNHLISQTDTDINPSLLSFISIDQAYEWLLESERLLEKVKYQTLLISRKIK